MLRAHLTENNVHLTTSLVLETLPACEVLSSISSQQ